MGKILLVEDDQILQQLYKDKLTFSGFEVVTATDGEEGLSKAKTDTPQLILLDIMLPKKNGFEVLDELKGDPVTRIIPVIMLTNLLHERDAEEALEKGALKYITKSDYEPEAIVKIIQEVLHA